MLNVLLSNENLLVVLSTINASFHSQAILYGILLIGAFLTAGVALSILTFYEDFYWSDEKFREQLRVNNFFRKRSSN